MNTPDPGRQLAEEGRRENRGQISVPIAACYEVYRVVGIMDKNFGVRELDGRRFLSTGALQREVGAALNMLSRIPSLKGTSLEIGPGDLARANSEDPFKMQEWLHKKIADALPLGPRGKLLTEEQQKSMINDYSQSLLNYQREFQQTKALGLSVPNIQRLVPIADQLAVIDPSQFQGAWRTKFLRMSHDQAISEITKVLNQPPFKK